MVNKDWTFEEVLVANEDTLAKTPGRSASDPTLPLFQWLAFRSLEHCKEEFERDSYWLMTAIRICANHDLPLPEWAAKAYIKAYDAVNNAREKSWDVVFGKPYPKGRHLKATREKRMLKFAVLNEVNATLQNNPDTAIDEYLFEVVGEKFNIKKTLASEYYYEAKKQIDSWVIPRN
jgi:hypothetical protein